MPSVGDSSETQDLVPPIDKWADHRRVRIGTSAADRQFGRLHAKRADATAASCDPDGRTSGAYDFGPMAGIVYIGSSPCRRWTSFDTVPQSDRCIYMFDWRRG